MSLLSYVAIISTAFFKLKVIAVRHELHVPFLESGIAHPGETIPRFQGTNTLFNPIAHTADQPVRKTLTKVSGLPRTALCMIPSI